MSVIAAATSMLATSISERLPVPDRLMRAGISHLVGRTHRRITSVTPDGDTEFAATMAAYPIAEHTAAANAQHYELPPEFFGLVLGPHRKYSSCLFTPGTRSLEQAEANALAETCAHADLRDAQDILELGCGWGSLSLWMAARYPAARITAVSNSASQRRYIMATAADRGLRNLTVITADMNEFDTAARFDRVVSVEMFEHMANWEELLGRVRSWLRSNGRLFLHVFAHAATPYRFDTGDKADWIARHFFTGGIMPSHGLVRRFPDMFTVERDWRWDGRHYQRTAEAWLANYDAHAVEIDAMLRDVYGDQARLWRRRWRLFFLAVSGMFGHQDGNAWGVSHYRLIRFRKMQRALASLRGYIASDDPRVATANLVAMVLAWNTPFYPLYLFGAAGDAIGPGAWLTLCAFPVFLAIPLLTRRYPMLGRVLLIAAGTANTWFCTWLLGEASGTQLFLLPCITLAALLFRRDEPIALFGFMALPIVSGVVLNGRYPVSPFVCSGAGCHGIVWLNAVSVAVLTAFLGVLGNRAGARPTRRSEPPQP